MNSRSSSRSSGDDTARQLAVEAAERSGKSVDEWLRDLILRSEPVAPAPVPALAEAPRGDDQPARAGRDPGRLLAAEQAAFEEISRTMNRLAPQTRAPAAQPAADAGAPQPAARIMSSLEAINDRIRRLAETMPAEARQPAPAPPGARPGPAAEAAAEVAAAFAPVPGGSSGATPAGNPPHRAEPPQAARPVQVTAVRPSPAAVSARDLDAHFGTLAAKIDELRSPGDAERIEAVAEDMRSLRDLVETLPALIAREEAAVAERLERKIDVLNERPGDGAALADLAASLAEMRDLVGSLSDRTPLEAIEERLAGIAARVEALPTDTPGPAIEALAAELEAVKDASARFDPSAVIALVDRRMTELLRRLDTGLPDPNALARMGEDVTALRRFAEEESRSAFGTLDARMAELAERARAFDPVMERVTAGLDALPGLAEDVALIRRIAEAPQDDSRLDALGAEIGEVSRRIDGLANEMVAPAISEMERHLGDLVKVIDALVASDSARGLDRLQTSVAELGTRLDAVDFAATPTLVASLRDDIAGLGARLETREMPESPALARIEAELRTLSERMERIAARPAEAPMPSAAIEARLDAIFGLLRAMEVRTAPETLSGFGPALERIEAMLTANAGPAESATPPLPDAVAAGVEAQLVALAGRLDRLEPGTRDSAALRQVEGQIAEWIDQLARRPGDLGTVTRAVERIGAAVDTLESGAPVEDARPRPKPRVDRSALVAALKADLRRIEDDLGPPGAGAQAGRPAKAGSGARDPAEQQRRAAPAPLLREESPTADAAPPVAAAAEPTVSAEAADPASPAMARAEEADSESAAAEPPSIADLDVIPEKGAAARLAWIASLDRAMASEHEERSRPSRPSDEPDEAEPAASDIDDNRPLEPGSGAPALARRIAAITARDPQRTSLDEDEDDRDDVEAARDRPAADYIAAARRAAQAAAIDDEPEAELRPAGTPGRLSRIGDALRGRRRPVILAAAALVLALAAIQIAGALRERDEPPAAITAEAEPTTTAPALILDPAARATAPETQTATPGATIISPAAAADDGATASLGAAPGADGAAAANLAALPAFPGDATTGGAASVGAAEAAPAPAAATQAGTATAAASDPAGPTMPMPPESLGSPALRQAAAAGDPAAQFEIAVRYSEGAAGDPDLAEAARWYEAAAEGGLAPAQYRIGSMYENGMGVAVDLPRARAYYEQAARAGNANAMHNLAVLFAEGGLGQPDMASAAGWFMRAADLGVRDSQYNLGVLFARGAGVPFDAVQSYKWFAIAAAGGDADAGARRDDVAGVLDADGLAAAQAAVTAWRPQPLDPVANAVPQNPAWAEATTAASASGQRALGDSSNLVAIAQRLLAAQGYDPGPPDGLMGQRTRDAVAAFQAAHGVTATGLVDAGLIDLLTQAET